jgi:hypothetical protein
MPSNVLTNARKQMRRIGVTFGSGPTAVLLGRAHVIEHDPGLSVKSGKDRVHDTISGD